MDRDERRAKAKCKWGRGEIRCVRTGSGLRRNSRSDLPPTSAAWYSAIANAIARRMRIAAMIPLRT